MKKLILSALVVIASSAELSAASGSGRRGGKTSFNKCLACHAIGEGAKNKVGPVAQWVRRAASPAPRLIFPTRTPTRFRHHLERGPSSRDYIKDPKAKIPGTKMIFPGIKNEKEVNDLWAFLAQYDKDGKDQVTGPRGESVIGNRFRQRA